MGHDPFLHSLMRLRARAKVGHGTSINIPQGRSLLECFPEQMGQGARTGLGQVVVIRIEDDSPQLCRTAYRVAYFRADIYVGETPVFLDPIKNLFQSRLAIFVSFTRYPAIGGQAEA